MLSLREENEMLREENRQLRHKLGLSPDELFFAETRARLGLTPSVARLLSALLCSPLCKKEHLLEAMTPSSWEERELKNVDVAICKLRKVLTPRGVEIETVWGVGFRISPEMRERTLTILQLRDAA